MFAAQGLVIVPVVLPIEARGFRATSLVVTSIFVVAPPGLTTGLFDGVVHGVVAMVLSSLSFCVAFVVAVVAVGLRKRHCFAGHAEDTMLMSS